MSRHRPNSSASGSTVFFDETPTTFAEATANFRKKPGRKPNPDTPALRKKANRLAQRAFRERKEQRLQALEKEIQDITAEREVCKVENQYLRNLVAMMQSVMFQHGLSMSDFHDGDEPGPSSSSLSSQNIPTKSDGASGNDFDNFSMYEPTTSVANLDPQISLDGPSPLLTSNPMEYGTGALGTTTVETFFQADYLTGPPEPTSEPMLLVQEDSSSSNTFTWDEFSTTKSMNLNIDFAQGTGPSTQDAINGVLVSDSLYSADMTSECPAESSSSYYPQPAPPSYPPLPDQSSANFPSTISIDPNSDIYSPPTSLMSTRAAVQLITMRLRAQSYSINNNTTFSIRPTPLQLAVPHDPRIDLIPTEHIRERLIVFRGVYELDHCLQMLLDQALFHGGDVLESNNWELSDEFINEYWFCCVHSDIERTNKWRRERGAPDVVLKKPTIMKLRKFMKYAEVDHSNNSIDNMLQESMDALTVN